MKGKKGRPRALTPEQLFEAKGLCDSGIPTKEVAARYGVTSETITCRLREDHGLRISKPRTHDVNELAFSPDEWTPEHSYWLGLLHSDGTTSGNSVTLGLRGADGYLVQQFADFCGYTGVVKVHAAHLSTHSNGKTYNHSEFHEVRIHSKSLRDRLRELGIRPNDKTIHPVPCGELDYLRGMFDGNGSIRDSAKTLQPSWMFCGRLESVTYFKEALLRYDPDLTIKGPRSDRNIFKIFIHKRGDVARVYRLLYGRHGPQMHRKASRMRSWVRSDKIDVYATMPYMDTPA